MAKLNFKDKWILVTGASSGLGKEMARYLAVKENANVVIAARRKGRLMELKKEIESACNSQVKVLEADVSTTQGVDRLFENAVKTVDIDAVVNNAGITYYGMSVESQLDYFDKIINVNLNAVIRLSLKFLAYFRERGGGALLNITSETAFIPIPFQNVYAASKHGAQAFTEGLYMEYRKSGIVICSAAPGGIATEMLTLSGLDKKHGMDSPFNMKADVAARKTIKAFKRKKFVYIPGFMNQLTVFLVRFFPRKWVARVTALIYTPPKENE
jgi:short-subunit dehydrogenase